MLGMAETQLPTPKDVASHNQEVDAANSANSAASKGIVPPVAGAAPPEPAAEPTPQSKPLAKAPATSSTNNVRS